MSKRPQIRHYYHVYADGEYRHLVRDHFAALKSSGLNKVIDHLHVGFVGSEENVRNARRRVADLAGRAFEENTAATGWEQETLDVLYHDAVAAAEPFLVLYAHTKGAANQTEFNRLWRIIMTRHTVTRWKQAVAAFEGPIGAAGCFWAPFKDTRFFGGNFWWARSEAIASIGRPDRKDRFGAEGWIGKITLLPKPYGIFPLFNAPLNLPSLQRFEYSS
jgi:hypothetical protein